MIRRLGYACINMLHSDPALVKKADRVTTNRTCRLDTFQQLGMDHIKSLVLDNARDLHTILEWNEAHGIRLFRLSSDMFPFLAHPEVGYDISDLGSEISEALAKCGEFIAKHDHRISSHPGPFNVLASPSPNVVDNTIRELNAHAAIFDAIGLPQNHNSKINIHVGGAYGDPDAALDRWCTNFARLSPSAQARITVENDDRASLYSVRALYDNVYKRTGVPIVFDYHHHIFCTGGDSEADALALAISTWPPGIVPTTHYSESHELHVGNDKPTPKHSILINALPDCHGHTIDIMIEAKGKEQALIPHQTLAMRFNRDWWAAEADA